MTQAALSCGHWPLFGFPFESAGGWIAALLVCAPPLRRPPLLLWTRAASALGGQGPVGSLEEGRWARRGPLAPLSGWWLVAVSGWWKVIGEPAGFQAPAWRPPKPLLSPQPLLESSPRCPRGHREDDCRGAGDRLLSHLPGPEDE